MKKKPKQYKPREKAADSEFLGTTQPKRLIEAIRKAANENRRTVSQEIRSVLEKAYLPKQD